MSWIEVMDIKLLERRLEGLAHIELCSVWFL